MEIDVVDINLEECEGFCIGEYESRGCTVIFDNTKNKISSNIDFTETKVEKCSVVRDKKYEDKMTLGDKMAKKKDKNIREIWLSERKFYQKVTDLYATAFDYDKDAKTTRQFFSDSAQLCGDMF